jgi:D-alanyl-lipoteichoic acid acyltransferase DltB (MBOAT superfamily)
VLFPTVRFALLFVVTWGAYLAVRDRPAVRRIVLLLASWVFYASWDWRWLALLWWIIGVNHVAARGIASARTDGARRMALWLGVLANLVLLGWFKYYGFFTESMVGALDLLGVDASVPLVQLALPLGISFLTFQAISYLIEVHRGVTEPAALLDEAVWLSFFATVVSGPITRASELIPQLDREPRCADPNASFALVLRGLFKKVVLASYLASAVVDEAFASPTAFSSTEVLFAVYAYGALIYVDFSGYTDMARGAAGLLGLHLPRNFDAPYRASSVQEFWTRWHMTLTRWLRDFLFTPLGLRYGRHRIIGPLLPLLIMLAAGLWHGAAWTFVVFGGIHGLALVGERAGRLRRRRLGLGPLPQTPMRRLLRHVATIHIVSLAWLFFRAESMDTAWAMLHRIATGPLAAGQITALAAVTVSAIYGAQLVQLPSLTERARALAARTGPVTQAAALAGALTVVDVLGPTGVAPFIYFGF